MLRIIYEKVDADVPCYFACSGTYGSWFEFADGESLRRAPVGHLCLSFANPRGQLILAAHMPADMVNAVFMQGLDLGSWSSSFEVRREDFEAFVRLRESVRKVLNSAFVP